ncbi:MAG: penicillin-binding protein 1A [Gammaproteobacteria bacterium]|nr:penicillin-binding protein 1A [Gammaproteobacteria bacterium]
MEYSQIPPEFIQAILAAEDARYFDHHGVDVKGLTRAVLELMSTGSIQSGGSTITMQVAKNYFLSSEKTFLRKFNEILLALKMERRLSKEQILKLYVNKIYLGHRAYGLHAAAQVYYGKPVAELSLAQLAMIAGLPKAPSAFNPVTNPARALERRNWILHRMFELGRITQAQLDVALAEPNTAQLFGIPVEVDAPYFAEMVRRDMVTRFDERADTDGFRVFTTLKADLQQAANHAVHVGLIAYDKRHGYRGPEAALPFTPGATEDSELLERLQAYRQVGPLQPVVIVDVAADKATALLKNGSRIEISWESMQWARPFIDTNNRGPAPQSPADVVKPGHIVRVLADGERWLLSQIPAAQSALVSLDADNGALNALVGGFDFQSSKFNRAVQAGRQAGSSFKPFIYCYALEQGMTPATFVNDAPIVFQEAGMETAWRPENSEGKFLGPIRLREALYKSRNLVSIRLLQSLGVEPTINYISQFGIGRDKLPHNLSMALGTASLTPLEVATGYAALANGGYKVDSWFIQRIEDAEGKVIFEANPVAVCDADCIAAREGIASTTFSDEEALLPSEPAAGTGSSSQPAPPATQPVAPRVVDPRAQFQLYSMLQDVIRRGTATRARELNRTDIAGKTGTTNDQKDAWFSGFNPKVVTTVWVGFDQPQNLGRAEFGGTAALPIWIDYMRVALKDSPQTPPRIPDGIATVRVDPDSGLRVSPDNPYGEIEYFREEEVPEFIVEGGEGPASAGSGGSSSEMPESLF